MSGSLFSVNPLAKQATIDKFINSGFGNTCMYEFVNAHAPRLDTILVIEDAIRKSPKDLTRTGLYRVLNGRVMYQTLKVVLRYLEDSHKITYAGNKIVWIFTNEKLEKAVSSGKEY